MKSDKLPDKLPRHIAFIMDGNGRWAKKRLLPRKVGHREGVKSMRKIVDACFEYGISYVSLYAFSTENKNRPQDEVQALFGLMEEYLVEFLSDMVERGVRLTTMGDISYFPESLRNIISDTVEKSRDLTRGTLNLALNYGARDEIVRAVNIAVKEGKQVDEQSFARLLYTADIPDPDLVVRTSGESRLSNFMLYQSAYSELCFVDTLWPDFGVKELRGVLADYSRRDRRFGKIE